MRPFASKASAVSLPPLPLRLLLAGATVARWESHPLKNDTFPRRTVMLNCLCRNNPGCPWSASNVHCLSASRRVDEFLEQGRENGPGLQVGRLQRRLDVAAFREEDRLRRERVADAHGFHVGRRQVAADVRRDGERLSRRPTWNP